MRRMRGFFNGWVVTLLFTATLGYFAVRHWPTTRTSIDTKPDTPVAIAPEEPRTDNSHGNHDKQPKGAHRDVASDSKRTGDDLAEFAAPHVNDTVVLAPPPKVRGVAKSFCESIEFRGSGPDGGPGGQWGRISTEQWRKVMTQFHLAKKDLLGWLDEHRSQFTKEVSDHMEKEVKDLRLQRPPTPDFPDLAFRGIGLWTRPQGEPVIIKLGGGFAKLVDRHPIRAKFELTRLIAQTWSPCELKRSPVATHIPAEGPWNNLLGCLAVRDDNACEPGSFSEAGWAVSSAIASVASPPGCTVPAFAMGIGEACLRDIRSTGSRLPAASGPKHAPKKEAHR